MTATAAWLDEADRAMTPKMPHEKAAALRAPFDPAIVGKLPRTTCRDCSDSSSKVCSKHTKTKCGVCDNWITTAHIHLDYVGHAAVTDRLLQVDPEWTWEPVAFDVSGLPAVAIDGKIAKLWIRLTVCGVTRLGVGSAQASKEDVEKELISDALRNAAMRFGVALDLWSKQDIHDAAQEPAPPAPPVDVDAIEAVKARVAALSDDQRHSFGIWKDDQGFPWPWPASAVAAMDAELDRISSVGGEPDAASAAGDADSPPESDAAPPPPMFELPPVREVEEGHCVVCGDPFSKTGKHRESEEHPGYGKSCEPW